MTHFEKRVGGNIRRFLEVKKRKHTWVIDRIGISKANFYNILDGRGNVVKYAEEIARLFRKDSSYFLQETLPDLESFDQIQEKVSFVNYVAASYHTDGDKEEFLESMRSLNVFVDMIDYLENIQDAEGE